MLAGIGFCGVIGLRRIVVVRRDSSMSSSSSAVDVTDAASVPLPVQQMPIVRNASRSAVACPIRFDASCSLHYLKSLFIIFV